MTTFHTKLPEVQHVGRLAFPSYKGRSFQVTTFYPDMRLDSYWDGGSKTSYVILNMANGRKKLVPENGTPFSNGGKIFKLKVLPHNCAVVAHSIFMGKDCGITIYVNSDNLTAMLPAPKDLTADEKIVLYATRSLKSSYAGISNYRFHQARRETGIDQTRWETAKASLIDKNLLNKRGAITDEGRNSVEGVWSFRDLIKD